MRPSHQGWPRRVRGEPPGSQRDAARDDDDDRVVLSRRVSVTKPLPTPPPASSAAVRAVMRGNRSRDTGPEVAVRSALHRRGVRFRKNHRPVPGIRCAADVVFPGVRIAVFIDGCYWHRCPTHGTKPSTNSGYWTAKLDRNVARDRRNDAELAAHGWTVLRFWEHENPDAVARQIADEVHSRRVAIPSRR
jgi:DNA mismatch endonuclease (patch repair protein)